MSTTTEYAILKTEKIKTIGELKHRFAHNQRTKPCPSVRYPERKNETLDFCTVDDFIAELPEKRRSDAVLAYEFFLGASPEWFDYATEEEIQDWIKTNREWLEEEFPTKTRNFDIHRDETTVHIHAILSVLDPKTGRLCAKQMIPNGGVGMRKLQDSYAKKMARFKLSRGVRGSQNIPERPINQSPDLISADSYKVERRARKALERTLFVLEKRLADMERTVGMLLNSLGIVIGRRLPNSLTVEDYKEIQIVVANIDEQRRQERSQQWGNRTPAGDSLPGGTPTAQRPGAKGDFSKFGSDPANRPDRTAAKANFSRPNPL
jgi:hypothetical protein